MMAAGPGMVMPVPRSLSHGRVLEIEGLTISLPAGGDRAHAVEGIELSVRRGEILCVVGESGSGKSMLAFATMNLLPKALKPVSGSIRLDGTNILRASKSDLR